MDGSPPGSSVHGILQAGILEWVAMPTSKGTFPNQGSNLCLSYPALQDRFFATSATWEALLHLRLCDKPNQNVLARNSHYFPEMEVGGGDTGFLFSHFFDLIWYTDQTGCPWYLMETHKEWDTQASSNIAGYTYFSSFVINSALSLAHVSQLGSVGMVHDIVRLPLKASGVWLLLSDYSSLFQLRTLRCSALAMLTFSPVLPNFHNRDSCSWNDLPLPPYPVNTYAPFRCHLGITAQRHLLSAPRQLP